MHGDGLYWMEASTVFPAVLQQLFVQAAWTIVMNGLHDLLLWPIMGLALQPKSGMPEDHSDANFTGFQTCSFSAVCGIHRWMVTHKIARCSYTGGAVLNTETWKLWWNWGSPFTKARVVRVSKTLLWRMAWFQYMEAGRNASIAPLMLCIWSLWKSSCLKLTDSLTQLWLTLCHSWWGMRPQYANSMPPCLGIWTLPVYKRIWHHLLVVWQSW